MFSFLSLFSILFVGQEAANQEDDENESGDGKGELADDHEQTETLQHACSSFIEKGHSIESINFDDHPFAFFGPPRRLRGGEGEGR